MNIDKTLKQINGLVFIVVALIPLVFIPSKYIYDFFYFPKVFALVIVGCTYLLILSRNKNRVNQLLEWDKINISLFVYFSLLIISLFFTDNIKLSIIGSSLREEGLITISMYMLIFILARSIRKIDEKLFIGIIFSASLISLYGILQYYGVEIFARDSIRVGWNIPFSTIGNPNFLGSYLVLIIPISMHLFIIKEKNYSSIVFGILFYCLLATMTRGAWIGATFAISLYIIFTKLYYKNHREILKRILILISIMIFIFIIFNIFSDGILLKRLLSIPMEMGKSIGEDSNSAGSGRVFAWKKVIELIKVKPWFGYGIENLRAPFLEMHTEEMIRLFGRIYIYDKAHNEYLNIAVTSGIPSLLAYLLFITFNLKRGMKRLKKNELIIPLMSSVIGYLIQAFFNISVVSVAYIFWAFLGLTAGRLKEDFE